MKVVVLRRSRLRSSLSQAISAAGVATTGLPTSASDANSIKTHNGHPVSAGLQGYNSSAFIFEFASALTAVC